MASQIMRFLPLINLQNMIVCLGVCLCHQRGQAGEIKPSTVKFGRAAYFISFLEPQTPVFQYSASVEELG